MRKPYPSDLTDEQGEIIKPLIPVHTVGRPCTVEMRQVLNAIFYLNRSGCQWDMLPHDLPLRSTVHDSSSQWRCDGTWQKIRDDLCRRVRGAVGKEPSPSAGSINSPTVNALFQFSGPMLILLANSPLFVWSRGFPFTRAPILPKLRPIDC
ncbi:MAG: transposase [Singulisphaera sp.]|nr:transposase [Singulisphaera sp.]